MQCQVCNQTASCYVAVHRDDPQGEILDELYMCNQCAESAGFTVTDEEEEDDQ